MVCPLFNAGASLLFGSPPPFVGACLNVQAEIPCAEKLNHKEISMTFMAKHIRVSINRPVGEVYEFASNPENLPQWAAGLSGSIKQIDEDWIAESPMGRVRVKFAEKNKFGVFRSRCHFTIRGQSL
jgi:hypothetical protein